MDLSCIMVNIKNNELKTKFNAEEFKKDAHRILNLMDYSDFDLGILFTDNKTMQRFNNDYRGKDKPTNILSFPYHTKINAGERIEPKTREDKNLGDIIIALPYVKEEAEKEKKSINHRLCELLCHGICHLLGYDHDTEETDKVMKDKERWLLEHCGKE